MRDDGLGLSETALDALQKGIGVSTTRARLQHQFGADYRFEFHRLEEGVAVVVALPWRTETLPRSRRTKARRTPAHQIGARRGAIGAMGATGARA